MPAKNSPAEHTKKDTQSTVVRQQPESKEGQPVNAPPAADLKKAGILHLQRSAGNRAVSQMLASQGKEDTSSVQPLIPQPDNEQPVQEKSGKPGEQLASLSVLPDNPSATPSAQPGGRSRAPEIRRVTGPRLMRQDEEPNLCNIQLPDGYGMVYEGLYYIFGTWRAGYTREDFLHRILDGWIIWRFGRSINSTAKASIYRRLSEGFQYSENFNPTVGCRVFGQWDLSVISEITRIVQRMPGAEAAEARESAAGLPSPDELQQAQMGESPQEGAPEGTAEGEPPQEGTQPAPEEPTPEGQPPREGPPVRESGSEFRGGTSGPVANAPAIPARVEGPDMMPKGSIGTYTMRLDYSIAGNDTLSQVVEAMNYVGYHWERFDITAMARQGLREQAAAQQRHQAVSEENEIGVTDAAGRRFDEAGEELSEDTATSINELVNPGGDTPGEALTRIYASELNLALLPASAIVSYGGVALGALADLLGGDFQEREVPLPRREGVFLIRCVAAPSVQGRQRRAASVATQVVEVYDIRNLARDALDRPMAAVDDKRLELEMARNEDPPNAERIARLEQELRDRQTAATGSAADAIGIALANKRAELPNAFGRQRERILEEIANLEALQERARTRAGNMQADSVFRLQAAMISRLTGDTYNLILQAGALPQEGSTYRYRISDVTTRDGEEYEGRGSSPSAAFWRAAERMAERNEYGRGTIAFRLPEGSPLSPNSRTFDNRPGPENIARQRLNDLAMVLVAASLVVPGVGEVAAVLGAALAADRLVRRYMNDSLRLDAAAVGDVLAILGAAAMGAQVIGQVRVARAGSNFVLAEADADMQALTRALVNAQRIERGTEIANQIVNWGGFGWGAASTLNEILRINQEEMSGRMTHAAARRARAQHLFNALRDGTLQFSGAARGHREGGTPAEEGRRPPAGEEGRQPPATGGEGRRPPAAGEEGRRPPAAGEEGRRPPAAGEEGRRPPATGEEGRRPPPAGEEGRRPPAEGGEPAHPDIGEGMTGRERVRARASSADGLHQVSVLEDGRIIRCSPSCGEMRAHFDEFLHPEEGSPHADRATDLNNRLTNLESRSRAASEAEASLNEEVQRGGVSDERLAEINQQRAGIKAEQDSIAADSAALEMDLRQHSGTQMAGEAELSGIPADRLTNLLGTFSPDEIRQMAADPTIGKDNLRVIGNRSEATIRLFGDLLDLTSTDRVAREELVRTLTEYAGRLTLPVLEQTLRGYKRLLERFPGRISGDMITRIGRSLRSHEIPQALAELRLAEDILEGRSPLGADRSIEGLRPPGEGQRVPEYRVTGPDGSPALAEVKRTGEAGRPLRENTLDNALRSALGQVRQQAARDAAAAPQGEAAHPNGYIRLDAAHTGHTALTAEQLRDIVHDRLRQGTPSGYDLVHWVEILYNDAQGNPQRLVIEARDGAAHIAGGATQATPAVTTGQSSE